MYKPMKHLGWCYPFISVTTHNQRFAAYFYVYFTADRRRPQCLSRWAGIVAAWLGEFAFLTPHNGSNIFNYLNGRSEDVKETKYL